MFLTQYFLIWTFPFNTEYEDYNNNTAFGAN